MNKEVEEVKKEEIKKEVKPKKELFGFLKKSDGDGRLKEEEKQTSMEEGLNLMPAPTKEEIEKEGKKAVLNVGSAFSLLTLVLVSVFIVSFNIISKIELNGKKEELYALEQEMKKNSQVILDNNDVLDRVFLYKSIEEETFSPKEVIEYIEDIASSTGGIDIKTYDIAESLSFDFTGESQDLEKVSKFWYLLCNDGSILNVNLDSVSKGESGARFSFEGQFIYEDFVKNSKDENN